MDTILDILSRMYHQILGRATGPLNFRLVVMPIVVCILAVRAHLRDVREGRPTVLWAFFKDPAERQRLLRSGLKDFGKVVVMAVVLDTTYQLLVFRWVYPAEVLFIAVACAIVPHFLVRGPIMRGLHLLSRKREG
ncbi:MAG: hypothetical protein H6Q86_4239 [candidate division NC10 bacterium]|nr:hypothetical protein [candidate division NC10 bacterium]